MTEDQGEEGKRPRISRPPSRHGHPVHALDWKHHSLASSVVVLILLHIPPKITRLRACLTKVK
jgi:hypothetical protein